MISEHLLQQVIQRPTSSSHTGSRYHRPFVLTRRIVPAPISRNFCRMELRLLLEVNAPSRSCTSRIPRLRFPILLRPHHAIFERIPPWFWQLLEYLNGLLQNYPDCFRKIVLPRKMIHKAANLRGFEDSACKSANVRSRAGKT
jgi:hypothetical protein